MPSLKFPTALLLLSLSLPLVSSCATRGDRLQTFPRAELLQRKSEPVRPVETVTSATADELYDQDVKAWGREGWGRVHAICVWAKERGMAAAPC